MRFRTDFFFGGPADFFETGADVVKCSLGCVGGSLEVTFEVTFEVTLEVTLE